MAESNSVEKKMETSRVIDITSRDLFTEKNEDGLNAIRIYPDPVLMKKAASVENIDENVKKVVDRMAKAMYANKGIGLAAPQIGILSEILIVDIGEGCKVLINPEIIEGEDESVMLEGCLSLPMIEVPVKRVEKVLIRGWNLEGKEVSLELFGFPGRVYQHEIDHLNGILIIHRTSKTESQVKEGDQRY